MAIVVHRVMRRDAVGDRRRRQLVVVVVVGGRAGGYRSEDKHRPEKRSCLMFPGETSEGFLCSSALLFKTLNFWYVGPFH